MNPARTNAGWAGEEGGGDNLAALPMSWVGLRFYADYFGISMDYAREIQNDYNRPAGQRRVPKHITDKYPPMKKRGQWRIWAPVLANYARN
jgi:hypothetical protein